MKNNRLILMLVLLLETVSHNGFAQGTLNTQHLTAGNVPHPPFPICYPHGSILYCIPDGTYTCPAIEVPPDSQISSLSLAPSIVPEPSVLTVFALGGACMVARLLRRKLEGVGA
jgi:hypothetical protein